MKTKRIVERYYAIRIGTPKRSRPYLMINPNEIEDVPLLFKSKAKAQTAIDDIKPQSPRIVPVEITFLP